MTYISKEQVRNIIDNAPKGTDPSFVVAGLLERGHTLEGYGNAEMVQSNPPKRDLLQTLEKVANVASLGVGKKVGQAIGTLAGYGISKIKGNSEFYDTTAPSPKQVVGDVIQGASLVGGLKLPTSGGILRGAGQVASLSGASALGQSLANNQGARETAIDTAKATAIGGVVGGVFGLLGKGISTLAKKTAPTALEFTSGVPKGAIQQAIKSPQSAKIGRTQTSVVELQKQAVEALKNPETGLYRALSDEFSSGLESISSKYGYAGTLQNTVKGKLLKYPGGGVNLPAFNQATKVATKGANAVGGANIANQAKSLFNDFRLTTKKGVIDFSKSSITKNAEQANIQVAFDTVSNWKDYTPAGLQTLAERIGSLRKFDTVSGTKQSAILGKLYNKVAGQGGLIARNYPELYTLRQNFAKNTEIYSEIGSIIGVKAKTPMAVTSAVNRLSNIFKEDKELYVNAVKVLSERSGTDILSILAGTEFQKVLPNFVRGLGGGSVVGVGASVLNPWLILLAPLFSPRAVGKIVETAPNVAKATKAITRSATSQAVGRGQ